MPNRKVNWDILYHAKERVISIEFITRINHELCNYRLSNSLKIHQMKYNQKKQ